MTKGLICLLGASLLFNSFAQASAILNDPAREKVVVTVKKDIQIQEGTVGLIFVGNKILPTTEKLPNDLDQKVIAKFGPAAVADKKLNPTAGQFSNPATFCWVQLTNANGGFIAKGTQFTSEGELAVQEYGGQTLWMWTNGFLLTCQNVASKESRATLGDFDLAHQTQSLTAKNLAKHVGNYFGFEVVKRAYRP